MATYVNNFRIPKNDDQNFGKAVDFSGPQDGQAWAVTT